jgi:hypothetical protein
MSLFCSNCRNAIPEGTNQCRICNNGFVHQLTCSTCGNAVARGMAICPLCERGGGRATGMLLGAEGDRGLSRFMPPSRRDTERRLALARGEHFSDAGMFGAYSDVTVPEDVGGLYAEIGGTIQTVLQLSARLAALAPADRTRATIRACRELAVILQEELETRRGSVG